MNLTHMKKTNIPEAQSGPWAIQRFTVEEDEADLFNLRLAMNGIGHRRIEAGTYTRLVEEGRYDPMMSDTPAELVDHEPFVRRASGRVLIAGLGLGLVAEACLRKPDVTDVTVIERDLDIYGMVAPWLVEKYPDGRLTVVLDDIYTWKWAKDDFFDHAWFDIWPDISRDNLEDFTRLRRRYTRRCGSMDFWALHDCERQRY